MSKKPVSLKKKLQISVAFVWIGTLIALLSKVLGAWCLLAGLSIAVAAVAYRYTMIRCPHCGYKLAESRRVPACCPRCGESLE